MIRRCVLSMALITVSLLNGGLIAWEAARQPTSTDVARGTPGTLQPTRNLIVNAEFVKSIGQRSHVKLMDARAPVQGIQGMHRGILDRAATAYCHVGQYARWVVFAARALGHAVRFYAGSFNDWTLNDRGPVVN